MIGLVFCLNAQAVRDGGFFGSPPSLLSCDGLFAFFGSARVYEKLKAALSEQASEEWIEFFFNAPQPELRRRAFQILASRPLTSNYAPFLKRAVRHHFTDVVINALVHLGRIPGFELTPELRGDLEGLFESESQTVRNAARHFVRMHSKGD